MTTVSVQPTTSEPNEREEFERVFTAHLLANYFCNEDDARIYLKQRNGIYVHHNTNNKWEGWQAAWQHQQKRIESLQAQLNVAVDGLDDLNTKLCKKIESLQDKCVLLEKQNTIAVNALESLTNFEYWKNVTGSKIATEALAEIKKIG